MFAFLQHLLVDNPLSRRIIAATEAADLVAAAPDIREGDAARGAAIVSRIASGHRIDWQTGSNPEERREAHRFDWLRDLKAVQNGEAAAVAARMLLDWIACEETHPQESLDLRVISDRLGNLLRCADFILESARDAETALCGLAARDLRRLTLVSCLAIKPADRLAAALALLSAGSALARQRKTRLRGEKLLLLALDGVINGDGGAPGGSPAATFLTLEALVLARTTLRAGGGQITPPLTGAIERVAGAVRTMRHPDGGLIGFGMDGGLSSHRIGRVLSASRTPAQPVAVMRDTGYARASAGDIFVFLDAGTARAGLPVEISADGRRLVVTRPGGMAGGLVNPAKLHKPEGRYDLSSEANDAGQVISARQSLGGYRHERTIFLPRQGADIRGEDRITAEGARRKQEICLCFPLPAGADVARTGDGTSLFVRPGDRRPGWRFRFRGAEADIIEETDAVTGRRAPVIRLTAAPTAEETVVNWGFRRIEG